MIPRHKQQAPPADKTEGAVIYLNNDSADGTPRITKAEIPYALFTPPA